MRRVSHIFERVGRGGAVSCGGEWRESLGEGGRGHTSGGARGMKQEGYKER